MVISQKAKNIFKRFYIAIPGRINPTPTFPYITIPRSGRGQVCLLFGLQPFNKIKKYYLSII
ncbi:MAG: hypothetical protein COZ07_03305 [Candidatus Infernicultor aquiphilus]|uniref:Uncharacterized protein n=1 Tax=Candidatus Infernicultor aquiphilus TaxID=1805029 RepID=A0A1J5GB31_9BACT|nr:MAG: hypothetical protein AUK42_07635 [Candidatus Atribacteria bacterium CG2_30_33_13]PIU25243.1 MAG: hypothetical protein COT11_03850 [Candidatus Atribacteria bacterium CG08_land_8_20_14_0_20_33_29]PIW11276.1 MAG: hypothetical protein COW35_07835 [Candidatus Atribacteria bacterium CG17_big_fil_post_rev_8_21_14_2_50_34_11]PIX33334.1 MAG: hypothetical protein COZ58_07950 [Candidatus Atribacteria bacterium CG_4_8_14_3_um_filter_34_18]PIY33132.1 MAG: hypothetical protein COZ07_03305 [Candidatus